MMAMGGVIWVHPTTRASDHVRARPGEEVEGHGARAPADPRAADRACPKPRSTRARRSSREHQRDRRRLAARHGPASRGRHRRPRLPRHSGSDRRAIGPRSGARERARGSRAPPARGRAAALHGERTIKIRGERGSGSSAASRARISAMGSTCACRSARRSRGPSRRSWTRSSRCSRRIPAARVVNPDGPPDRRAKFAKFLDVRRHRALVVRARTRTTTCSRSARARDVRGVRPADPSKSNELPQLAFWQNQMKHQRSTTLHEAELRAVQAVEPRRADGVRRAHAAHAGSDVGRGRGK
jgi:hypothetical protein